MKQNGNERCAMNEDNNDNDDSDNDDDDNDNNVDGYI